MNAHRAKSSSSVLWNEQNENVDNKSEEQIASQENKYKGTSIWRDESAGTNGKEWEHLRILMEEERKNKVIKPVEVYKCSITERFKQ